MSKFSFNKINETRRNFLKENCKVDHVVICGKNNVLISAPHGVFQTRNVQRKVCEPGSLSTALLLQKLNDTFLIAKTKNNFDDANFDVTSPYKNTIKNIVEKNEIKYVLDFHGLSKTREMDINLGTDYGKNVEVDKPVFDKLVNMLTSNNFVVTIDTPFRGGGNTISGFSRALDKNIFSLQVEINSAITNDIKNKLKYYSLLEILSSWIKAL